MANQYDIFSGAPPKSHHATRVNADAYIVKSVALALQESGANGLTAEEASIVCRIDRQQAQSALSEIRMFGQARKLEMKRTSSSGALCSIYIWTEKRI
jgi:hypothetical protein